MSTRVVNLKAETYDVYVGRASSLRIGLPEKGWDGRFGNPFVIGRDGDRDEVVRKHKAWMWARLNKDREFLRRVLALEGKALGCFCSPERCHGDNYVAFLEWVKTPDGAAWLREGGA